MHAPLRSELDQDCKSGIFTQYYAACYDLNSDKFLIRESNSDASCAFDLASITKCLVTSPLILNLLSAAGHTIDAQVKDVCTLPHAIKHLETLTFRALLRHFSGLPAWRNFYTCRIDAAGDLALEPARRDWIVQVLSRVHTNPALGGHDLYSDLNYILLGLLIELHSGRQLDQEFSALKHSILFSGAVGFANQFTGEQKFVPTGYCKLRQRELIGEVWDENTAALGGVAGHCGLFSSGDDLCSYISHLLRSPIGKMQSQLSQQLIHIGNPSLIGFRQGNDYSAEVFGNGKAMGHLGFTGTAFWIDTATNRLAVFLTNRVIAGRVHPQFRDIRRRVFLSLNEA